MKLLLVNPPNGLFDLKYLAPPLGLLTLAAAVEKCHYEVVVLDLNFEVIADHSLSASRFYEFACDKISAEMPDVVGFTSMCLESHVSLEIARRLRGLLPETKNIFGGTHFGAIPRQILQTFSFVDYVITEEGEHAVVAILDCLSNIKTKEVLPRNVWYRDNEKIVSGSNEQKRPVLEELPFPAYHLIDLQKYFMLNPDHLLNYEAGRGCVFKCSFCYSPFQYGDAVRNKPPDRVIEDLRYLSALGARHIFLVQDNLLNSPVWASALCHLLGDAALPLTWECYATYPQLSEPIIDLLSQAGCVGVFTGIDAVSPESQIRMNKPFLKSWETTRRRLSYCREKGILPICAFILEGPTQPTDSIDNSIIVALECLRLGCEIHINTLTLYNGTALESTDGLHARTYSQIKPELLFDTPEVVQVNPFARSFPHLFPYHSTDLDLSQWEIFTAKVFTLYAVMLVLRETAYEYTAIEGNSLWKTLDYVDTDWVESLRRTPAPQKRWEAIMGFARNMSQLQLSIHLQALLRRELAQVILASRDVDRWVNLKVDDSLETFVLGSFICVSAGQHVKFEDDVVDELMLESQMSLGASLSTKPTDRTILALRSETNSIRYYDVDQSKLELLISLLRASRSDRPFALLTPESFSQLIQEGWIWRVTDVPLRDLPIRHSLRRMTQNFGESAKNY